MAKKQKKIFFWLKLDKNFFKNLAIKQALRMPGGKDMVIIYQMLMLESLATDGVIYYDGTLPTLEKELAVRLDINEEEIQMTLAYFKNVGLIQIDSYNNAEMLQVNALMEQETDWARYKREQRKQLKLDNVQPLSNDCPTEIEIEIEIELEKELEIELEKDENSLSVIAQIYQQKIGVIDGGQFQRLTDYVILDGINIDVVLKAISEAADNGKRNFKYINAILRNWKQDGIKTLTQVEERERQRIERRANSYGSNSLQHSNVPSWSNPDYKELEMTADETAELERIQKKIMDNLGKGGK